MVRERELARELESESVTDWVLESELAKAYSQTGHSWILQSPRLRESW